MLPAIGGGGSQDCTFLYESIKLARCPSPHAWDQAMQSADRRISSGSLEADRSRWFGYGLQLCLR